MVEHSPKIFASEEKRRRHINLTLSPRFQTFTCVAGVFILLSCLGIRCQEAISRYKDVPETRKTAD